MTRSFQLDQLDLLRQRRLELGLPPESPPLVAAGRLLLAGGVVGVGVVALAGATWLAVQLRQVYVEARIRELGAVPAQVKDLEQRLKAAQSQLSQIKTSTEGLAKGLVAVSSGSALVAQLSEVTPEGVQLTEATVAGSLPNQALTLKGNAADPEAFRRINAIQLLLAYSPLFKPDGVALVKAIRGTPPTAADPKQVAAVLAPVDFEMKAPFQALPAVAQLRELKRLGAEGMARRLETLQKEGLLP